MQLMARLWAALTAGLDAAHRAWIITGQIDGRERRRRLRLAALDDRDIERLEAAGDHDHHRFREELWRRGIVRWLP